MWKTEIAILISNTSGKSFVSREPRRPIFIDECLDVGMYLNHDITDGAAIRIRDLSPNHSDGLKPQFDDFICAVWQFIVGGRSALAMMVCVRNSQ